jgi:hypothetical protein
LQVLKYVVRSKNMIYYSMVIIIVHNSIIQCSHIG